MTRTEYIRQLMEELSFLPEENCREVAAFYMEMLDDRMEDGMEEEKAVAAMEEPKEIARRIREEYAETTEKDIPDPANVAEQAMQMARNALEAANRAIERAAGSAGKDNEQSDYEANAFVCDAGDIQSIRLEAANMSVKILPCEGKQITLTYYSCAQDEYTAGIENGELYLRHLGGGRVRRNSFSFFGFGMHWSNVVNASIQLELPKNALTDLRVKTSNASIRLEGMDNLCDTVLQSSNARVAVENTRCKSLDIHTSNGRIALGNVQARQFLQGKTSNGRIVTQNLSCNGKIDLTTSNGRIEADIIKAEEISLRTSNGNLTAFLPGKQQDWQIDSGTSNGKNNLPKFQAGEKPLHLHTSNGSLQADFKE